MCNVRRLVRTAGFGIKAPDQTSRKKQAEKFLGGLSRWWRYSNVGRFS